jgi:hypothetical protein
MPKVFCTTGLKGKNIDVSDDIIETTIKQKKKIPLIIDEGELKGAIGMVEPAGSKSIRINIPPYSYDEIYDNIESYEIKKISSDQKQVLFLLTK